MASSNRGDSPTAKRAGRTALKPKLAPHECTTWRGAIARDWKKLQQAPAQLRGEPGVVLGAMRSEPEGHWRALQYASEELRSDPEFMKQAMRLGGLGLQFGTEAILQDREVVLEAVKTDGCAIQYAFYNAHRDDREVVLEAMRQDWRSLRFASERLRGDKEIALEAVQLDWRVVQFLTEELQADREIMLEAVRADGEALRYASETLRADPGLVREANERNWSVGAEGNEMSFPQPDMWTSKSAAHLLSLKEGMDFIKVGANGSQPTQEPDEGGADQGVDDAQPE